MKRPMLLALLAACAGRAPAYPPARQDNVRETLHGVEIVDPYRWLEDQSSPETRAWIDAQNRYTHVLLDPFPGRAAILARLTALARVDSQAGPRTDRVVLDPHPLSADRTTNVYLDDHRFENNNPPALLEYGDAGKPDEFRFLRAYSPHQKVTPGVRYPAVLFVTGDADTRVPPLQARKMTARVQAATASGRPVLLLYDTKAGHSGGKPLSKVLEDQALELGFLASERGLKP